MNPLILRLLIRLTLLPKSSLIINFYIYFIYIPPSMHVCRPCSHFCRLLRLLEPQLYIYPISLKQYFGIFSIHFDFDSFGKLIDTHAAATRTFISRVCYHRDICIFMGLSHFIFTQHNFFLILRIWRTNVGIFRIGCAFITAIGGKVHRYGLCGTHN